MIPSMLHAVAPAKVNIGIEVLRKRPDGYHDIASLVQTVSLFDLLTLRNGGSGQVTIEGANIDRSDNLVAAAIDLISSEIERAPDFDIHLEKQIPLSAGLGGGSADAAATLLLIARHWGLPSDPEQLMSLSSRLGSDVALYMLRSPVLLAGRGDQVTKATFDRNFWIVLFVPDVTIPHKTHTMYGTLQQTDMTSGEGILKLIHSGTPDFHEAPPNPFRSQLYRHYPELAAIPDAFQRAGARFTALTGAGPTHYTITREKLEAQGIASRLQSSDTGPDGIVRVVEPIPGITIERQQ